MPLRVRVPPLSLVTPSSVTVSATGIPSKESFGTAFLTAAKVTQVSAFSISSQEAFGNHAIISTSGGSVTVFPFSILSAEAFGGTNVRRDRRYYPRHMRKFIGRR